MEDNVIYTNFGSAREWEATRKKTIEGLVTVGSLFGDDPKLMKAKGEAVLSLLKDIIEDMPNIKVTVRMPEDFPPEMVESFRDALSDAAVAGVEKAIIHAVDAFLSRIYDLCTSKLKEVVL